MIQIVVEQRARVEQARVVRHRVQTAIVDERRPLRPCRACAADRLRSGRRRRAPWHRRRRAPGVGECGVCASAVLPSPSSSRTLRTCASNQCSSSSGTCLYQSSASVLRSSISASSPSRFSVMPDSRLRHRLQFAIQRLDQRFVVGARRIRRACGVGEFVLRTLREQLRRLRVVADLSEQRRVRHAQMRVLVRRASAASAKIARAPSLSPRLQLSPAPPRCRFRPCRIFSSRLARDCPRGSCRRCARRDVRPRSRFPVFAPSCAGVASFSSRSPACFLSSSSTSACATMRHPLPSGWLSSFCRSSCAAFRSPSWMASMACACHKPGSFGCSACQR